MKVTIVRKSNSVSNMFRQLKSDLKNGSNVSYSSGGIGMLLNGQKGQKGQLVSWWMADRRLKRWTGNVCTTSSDVVKCFQYHGVLGRYMAVEIVTSDDIFYSMIPVN